MFRTTSLLGLCAFLFYGGVASAATIHRDLVVTNELVAPAGVARSAILVGNGKSAGSFPGPLISGNKGDRFQLNVTDRLTDPTMLRSTSIHWHGIHQVGTTWADGPTMVSQCPIVPNNSFVYDFSVYGQVGTYWYHSHYSTQYCDGLRGAFVVYDPDDPYKGLYDVDDESTVITLADWYDAVAPSRPAKPGSTLINGLGRSFANPGTSKLAVINVEEGKRYRFRIVGLSCDVPWNFTIHNHAMTVIEADGEYTSPIIVDQISVFAGQRFSVIVHANQAISNYWIRASPYPTRVPQSGIGFQGGINSAILRYVGATDGEPTTTYTPTLLLREADLRALVNPEAPGSAEEGGADISMPIRHFYNATIDRYLINGAIFESPSVPVLLQILNGTYAAEDLMPEGTVYKLPHNKSIELSIYGTGHSQGGPHPFHLHGHSFSVVKSAYSNVYNYENPVRRDTVDTGLDGDFAVIRFVTDNSGPWFLHCHIDWHIDMGLAIVFAEDPEGTKEHNSPIPPAFDELCPLFADSPIATADAKLHNASYPPIHQ